MLIQILGYYQEPMGSWLSCQPQIVLYIDYMLLTNQSFHNKSNVKWWHSKAVWNNYFCARFALFPSAQLWHSKSYLNFFRYLYVLKVITCFTCNLEQISTHWRFCRDYKLHSPFGLCNFVGLWKWLLLLMSGNWSKWRWKSRDYLL